MKKPRGNYTLSPIALMLLKEASIGQQMSQSAILESLIRQHLSPKEVAGAPAWNELLSRIDELESKGE